MPITLSVKHTQTSLSLDFIQPKEALDRFLNLLFPWLNAQQCRDLLKLIRRFLTASEPDSNNQSHFDPSLEHQLKKLFHALGFYASNGRSASVSWEKIREDDDIDMPCVDFTITVKGRGTLYLRITGLWRSGNVKIDLPYMNLKTALFVITALDSVGHKPRRK